MKLKKFFFLFLPLVIFCLLSSCNKNQPVQEQTASSSSQTQTTSSEKTTDITETTIDYSFDKSSLTITLNCNGSGTLDRDESTRIYNELYASDYKAETVIISEGFKKIDRDSLRCFADVKYLFLPSSLTSIDEYALCGCLNLIKIVVDPANQFFTTDAFGALFSKDMTSLVLYPSALPNNEYRIPETVTTIYSNAFYSCPNLKELNMSPNLSGNFTHWFYCCDNLNKVMFPTESKNFFCDEQGVVYTADTKEIVFVPTHVKILEFPEDVSSFIDHAIINVNSIEEIIVAENTSDIIDYLYRFPSLKKISVHKQNKNYSSLDGVLYSKDKAVLLWYPPMKNDKTFFVPDNVDYIFNIQSESLERFIISDSVTTIHWAAFLSCKGLKYLHIGKGLKKIEYNGEFTVDYENIFDLCVNLQKITVDPDNRNFIVDKYGALCTADLKNIITLPADSKTKKYVVNDNVEHIISCFKHCKNLEEIHIGKNVDYVCIGEADTESVVGFAGCVSLKKVTVSADNEKYTSIDGVLYSKDRTELCLYPANKPDKEFSVPDTVEIISDFAFLDNQNLEKLFVTAKVNPFFIFNFTNYQKNFELPLDVYYSGSKEDWPYENMRENPRLHFNAKSLPKS